METKDSPSLPSQPRRAEEPGERQAAWILGRMEDIQGNPDMSLDARELLQKMSSGSQKYLGYILREGPKGLKEVAAHFKATEAAVQKAVNEVTETLKQVLDD